MLNIKDTLLPALLICVVSTCTYGQNEMKEWYLRKQLANELRESDLSELGIKVEQITALTNPSVIADKIVGMCQLNASMEMGDDQIEMFFWTYAATYMNVDLDSVKQIYRKSSKAEEIAAVKKAIHPWLDECRKQFGASNVAYDETSFTVRLSNIPFKALYSKFIGDTKWEQLLYPETLPAPINGIGISDALWREIGEDFPRSQIEALAANAEYYPVDSFSDRFPRESKALKTRKLQNALEHYVKTISSRNHALTMMWSHPEITAKYDMTLQGLNVVDIGNAHVTAELIEVSEIQNYGGGQYAKIALNLNGKYDFSGLDENSEKSIIVKTIGTLAMELEMVYGVSNGFEENVIIDEAAKTIEVRNMVQDLYAIWDPAYEGWKFTNQLIPGENIPVSLLLCKSLSNDKNMAPLIPEAVLRKWAKENMDKYKEPVLEATDQFKQRILDGDLVLLDNIPVDETNYSSLQATLDSLHFKVQDVVVAKGRTYGFLTLERYGETLLHRDYRWGPLMCVAYFEAGQNNWELMFPYGYGRQMGKDATIKDYLAMFSRYASKQQKDNFNEMILSMSNNLVSKKIEGTWWLEGNSVEFSDEGAGEVRGFDGSQGETEQFNINHNSSPPVLTIRGERRYTGKDDYAFAFISEDEFVVDRDNSGRFGPYTRLYVRESIVPEYQDIRLAEKGEVLSMSAEEIKSFRVKYLEPIIEFDTNQIIAQSAAKLTDRNQYGNRNKSVLDLVLDRHDSEEWKEARSALRQLPDEQFKPIKLSTGQIVFMIHSLGKRVGYNYWEAVNDPNFEPKRSHILFLFEKIGPVWQLINLKIPLYGSCYTDECISYEQNRFWELSNRERL
jgi:hypothetical protein